MDDELCFGIFHTTYERDPAAFYKTMACDYVNTLIVECDYAGEHFRRTFEELRRHPDKKAWVAVTGLGFRTLSACGVADTGESGKGFDPQTVFLEDYRSRVNDMVALLKREGWYDSVLGFYMDEPLLWNITNDELEAFTGYFRTVAAPDKRFFVCFSVAGVAPEYWTINDIRPITPSSVRYLTDIAFDMYHKWSGDYEAIARLMLQRAGDRKDLRVWFIPCTMDYRGDKTEEYCLEHLEGCYDLLKKAEVPGGLMCFTHYTFLPSEEDLGNVGLDRLTDPKYPKYWPRLEGRIREIGREIVSRNREKKAVSCRG